MRYEGMIYRPPSEAYSLIVQVTVGCSHNACTFCTMYKEKKFHLRPMEEILEDLDNAAKRYGTMPIRIFLADGDALVLSNRKLMTILTRIRQDFPLVERVTSYARAGDILRKTPEELTELKNAGLSMVYVGAESGDPETLLRVKKGVTNEELIAASAKLAEAGIELSLTLISGLGGQEHMREHAIASAELVNAVRPRYLGFLTLMLEEPAPILEEVRNRTLTLLTQEQVVEEMVLFLNHVDSEGTVFRSNHASNYITLKGTLNKDIPAMLDYLEEVRKKHAYRSEWSRAL